MNLNSLIQWAVVIVLGLSAVNHVGDIHKRILKVQAQLIYESRTDLVGQNWSRSFILNSEKIGEGQAHFGGS